MSTSKNRKEGANESNYSLEPLRLKARQILSMVSFSGAVLLPGVASWTLTHDLKTTPMVLILLGYMFFTYCTMKNLPDYDGDKLAGLRTSATIFNTKQLASKVAAVTLITPFFLLTGLIHFGLISNKYAILYLLVPIVLYLGHLAVNGDSYQELEKLHTFGLIYVVLFLVITLLIISSTVMTAGFVATTLMLQAAILRNKLDSR
jgi:4-hydroxybenzoate polyprenyltransferase